MTSADIFWNIFLGMLGFGYMVYGKTLKHAVPVLGGLLLLVVPYLSSNHYAYLGATILVVIASYTIKY